LGVPQNFSKAAKWYARATELGYADSRYYLALMHAYGRGFNQDFTRALELFREGAQQAHSPSMLYLGKFFLFGHGVAVDYDSAVMWFDQAAKGGDKTVEEEAIKARNEIMHLVSLAKQENERVQKHYGMKLAEEEVIGIPVDYRDAL